MAQSSHEPKFSMRLIVDEEKKKVVLAEACRDFVDVLFSIMTLPMGTIVRLLENHTVTVGCFSNLYRSVVEMGIDNFETEACKQMLLYPRSVRDVECKRLKLNINPTEDVKCFKCRSCFYSNSYSNFSSSQCCCGSLINEEIQLEKEKVVAGQSDVNGVFVNGRCSFILTDDLKVEVKSTELVLEKLKSLGCADVSKLNERFIDIGLEEVLTLLECIFSSNTPLTDSFLNKPTPQSVTKFNVTSSQCMLKKEDAEPEKVVTLKAFARKQDMKILFVECGEDFVELFFSFLAVPLESVWEITGDSISLGCIGNLCRSFKDLTANKQTEASTSKCVIPSFYDFQMQLPGIITQQPPIYYRYRLYTLSHLVSYGLTTNGSRTPNYRKDRIVPVVLVDPKSCDQSTRCYGFLKKETKFTVLDDLTITSVNSCSTVSLLKKLQSHADNLEVQEVSISNAEALNLLGASLVTSSALSTALWNFISKKSKEERDLWNPTLKKPKEET